MDDMDIEVLTNAAQWLRAGYRALLVTVVGTWGSSPRPEGSMLVIRDDGHARGSVSGGCIEDDLIEQVQRDGISATSPSLVTYGVAADEAHRFGLPCGGTIRLVLEPLRPHSRVEELVTALLEGRLLMRSLDMSSGNVQLETASATDGLRFDGAQLISIHGPRYRMLLIGAGQLTRHVANIAVGLGYDVTVCDPREVHAHEWDIPHTRFTRTMPDDAVIEMRLDHRSAVIALTHDPKLDDLALMEALRTPAFYIGAIGSRSNNAARRERLKLFDLDDAAIARLHGPVGLYIGSRTPPEIALSILAEVTACKNNVRVERNLDIAVGKAMDSIGRRRGVLISDAENDKEEARAVQA